MDKRLLSLLLIAYIAVLVGCTGSGQPNIRVDDDYRTGTGTVQLSFASATTTKLFEGESGVVLLNAKNAGAFSLVSGRVVLSTDDSVLFFGSKEQFDNGGVQANTKNLVKNNDRPFFGKTAVSPNGDSLTFDFPIYALKLPQESQQRSAKIVAVACFPYETFQSTNVCIDTDPYGLRTSDKIKDVCDTKDLSMSAGGGPINAQSVQVRFENSADGQVKPTFYFTVSASGSTFSGMKFFAPGSEQSFCDSRISSSTGTVNDVVFFKATLSDRSLICNGDLARGYRDVYQINLFDNTARVSCSTDGPLFQSGDIVGNYYAPLSVNISYGVVVSTSQTVQVNALR